MKNKKLAESLNEIDDRYLAEAAAPKARRPYWIAAVAAILALIIVISVISGPQADPGETHMNMDASPNPSGTSGPTSSIDMSAVQNLPGLLAAPSLPTLVSYPRFDEYNGDYVAFDAAMSAWRKSQQEQFDQPDGYADSLTDFFIRSNREFLSGEENQAFSPVNVYLAMAMLAETTGGTSRQEILDLFGAASIEQLRQQADYLWNAHYNNDGQTTLLLANSLWLHNTYTFHQDTVDRLSSLYAASVFSDDLRTEEANQQLRTWLNAMTGGLLQDQAGNTKFPEYAVFALASTIYFKAGWEREFPEALTKDDTFHAPSGDISATFMGNRLEEYCYYGSNFSAIRLQLTGNNNMWIILPDEGVTVAEVLAGEEYLRMTLDPDSWSNRTEASIHVTLPKFDISSQSDLVDGMKNLGLCHIFDHDLSDFSPLTSDSDRLAVTQINHAARVAIDEKGIIAAAYTVIFGEDESLPPSEKLDFIVDRPFLFVVSSRDHLPLFSGVVTEP